MTLKTIATAAIAGLLTLSLAAPLTAQEMLNGAEAIAKRQELMKSNGMSLRTARQGPGPEATAAAETLVENFAMLPDLWPEPSMEGDTKALPAVWENMDDFQMKLGEAHTAAQALLEAAKGEDSAAYQTAFRTMGASCGGCHQSYQAD